MQVIGKYFSLSETQAGRFAQLDSLYNLWNERINLISRKDIANLYVHHVLHSLSIAKIITFKPGSVVIDAGTGGGFPGIPLAILFPETRFILTDSIRKKIQVVKAIAGELGLNNCETRNVRLEDLKDMADFVVCRAVAEIPALCKWIKKNVMPVGRHSMKNGLLALKGGDLTAELKQLKQPFQIFNLNDYFEEEFFETKKLVHVYLG
ncbi:MAG TPA: 16S rRNA (guanine(527)-N(7))-methyltransferase RsmG [Bacteroidales bacterium]|nr:16S rRNA (guanine(527)-N(7))-methyltransferase RsmG [Bacteroidales bacterium]